MIRQYHNRHKSTHAAEQVNDIVHQARISANPLQYAGFQTRNAVVYDEVVLSPTTTPSSVIPTEPNTAYVTTTIPTDQNVAYAVHSSS
ncbi:hypothetical protein GBAR_LOCUS28403 [Geodia barretti]|uniref:Uncharacterized protein n=1 Tax=Geodia barretti TaxID=519541 RepID=A0AA35TP91_GEOBA|nr:hypothetical protein GBAR_LOCUS28403 [Geodia barretti]